MKLGFDIDGCLANFTDSYAAILNRLTGIEYPKASKEWPPVWYWDRASGVTKEQEKAAWKEIIDSWDFWFRLDPLPEAKETLARINELRQEHDIYFITNRPGETAKWQTEAWLITYGIDYPTVLIASDKGPLIRSLGINVYIDDKPETMAELGWVEHPYLVDWAYNRDLVAPTVIRVASVKEALEKEGLW